MGFEPMRAMPNGLAVHRLNRSATSSAYVTTMKDEFRFFMKLKVFEVDNYWNKNNIHCIKDFLNLSNW